MTTNGQIGQKVWSYCNVLRDAGLSYGDYLEQITYLIFLKMMDERSQPPYTDMPRVRAATDTRALHLAAPRRAGRR